MTTDTRSTRLSISRAVKRIHKAQATEDGAGVSLHRAIGSTALRDIDPFLLLDEIHSSRPGDYLPGFPPHPHRGFETLTYLISGRMRHRDSQGNEGVIGTGGAQWMRAARGIVHSEMPEQDNGLLWGYQLWINLPAARKMDAPQYHDIPASEIPVLDLGSGGFIKVIAGRDIDGRNGPVVRDDIDLVFLDVFLPAHTRLSQALPAGHVALAYVAEGEVEFGCSSNNTPAEVRERTLVVFDEGDHVSAITGRRAARLLLMGASPIGESIVRQGPFVMNTEAEIRQAFLDYRNGDLGRPAS